MNYLAEYVLPKDIAAIIASGRDSAQRHIANLVDDPIALANMFRRHHIIFCTASRHNPNTDPDKPVPDDVDPLILNSQDRRENFQIIVNAAAACVLIADRLHGFSNQEPILEIMREVRPPFHKSYSDGSPQLPIIAEKFYTQYTQRQLHYRIREWLPKVLAESKTESEKACGVETLCLEALQEMLVGSRVREALPAAAQEAGQFQSAKFIAPSEPSGRQFARLSAQPEPAT